MGSSLTKSEQAMAARHAALGAGLNKPQRALRRRQRARLEAHTAQLLELARHTLSEQDIKRAAAFGVAMEMTLDEMRRALAVFSRMASTTERFCTVHEISLYFNVRRTVLLELCVQHLFGKERMTFPQLLKTCAAFLTCDHYELIRVLVEYCSARGESTLESVLTAVHGAPFEGDVEALIVVLSTLETVRLDVGVFDRALQAPAASVEKLVELNAVFPSLLFPTFKLQAGLREKFLGKRFWNRLRNRNAQLGLRGMFSLREFEEAVVRWERRALERLSGAAARRRRWAWVKRLRRWAAGGGGGREDIHARIERIRNYRPFQSASVVDMNADNSADLAWQLSCVAVSQTLAVEVVLDQEAAHADELAEEKRLFPHRYGGRTQVPGDPTIWVELTEGIYRPEVWRRMSDNAGYAICQRVKQGVAQFAASAEARGVELSKMLQELAGDAAGDELDGVLSDAERRQLAIQEQKELNMKLEKEQRDTWDLYWRSFVDPRTQRPFFFNFLTGERQWERPRGMGRHLRNRRRRKPRKREQTAATTTTTTTTKKKKRRRRRRTEEEEPRSEGQKDGRVEEDELGKGKASPIGRGGRQLPRSQSMMSAQRLIGEKWGADADERKGTDTLGSARPLPIPVTAAGEASENVPLYVGNRITVVVGASAYRVVTEKATLTQVNKKAAPPTYSVMYNDGFVEEEVPRVRVVAY